MEERLLEAGDDPASEHGTPPLTVDAPSATSRVVTPFGELDAHTAPGLRAVIQEQLADPEMQYLVVDLSRTTFLDSSVLGVLIGALKRLRGRGGRLVVVQPPLAIRRIFEITALDRVLELRDTRDDAVADA